MHEQKHNRFRGLLRMINPMFQSITNRQSRCTILASIIVKSLTSTLLENVSSRLFLYVSKSHSDWLVLDRSMPSTLNKRKNLPIEKTTAIRSSLPTIPVLWRQRYLAWILCPVHRTRVPESKKCVVSKQHVPVDDRHL